MAGDDELVQIAIRLKDARRFIGDAKGSARAVDEIGDRAERTGREMDGAGRSSRYAAAGFGALTQAVKIGAVALAGASVVIGTYSVNAAANLGEQVSKNTTVFRGAEKQVLSWAETTAASIGLSSREALEAAGAYGSMFRPMGFSAKAAATMSTEMVNLAGDMASFNNADPSEVLDNLRAGLSGEAEPLRKFGVFLNAAKIEAEAFSSGIAKQGSELTDAMKTQAAYNIIMRETKLAHGDFAKTSNSLPNQLRILRATTEDVAAAFGTALLPHATSAVSAITSMVSTFDRARASGARFGFAIATALDAGAGGGTKFRDLFRKLEPVVLKVMGGIRRAIAVAVPAVMEFGRGIIDGLAPAMPFLTNIVLPLVVGIGKGIVGSLVMAWKVVWPVFQLLFAALGKVGTAAAPFRKVFESIGLVIGLVFAGPILKGIGLLGKLGGVFGVIGGIAAKFGKLVVGSGKLVAGVAGTVVKSWLKLAGWWFGTLHGIGKVAVTVFGKLGGVVKAGMGKAMAVLTGLGAKFGTIGSKLWGKLVDGMKRAFGTGAGFVKDVGGRFLGWLVGQLNVAIPNKLGPVNLPNNPISLPGFAGGGVLRAGTGIVGEHRPEAITVLPSGGVRIDPLPSRLARRAAAMPDPFAGLVDPFAEASAAGGGGTLTVEVPVYLDGQLMHRAVARDVNRKAARK